MSSTSVLILNSLYLLFNLMNSSKRSIILFSVKFVLKLGTDSARSWGGIESLGPPVGRCILAHRIKLKDNKRKILKNTNDRIFSVLTLLERFSFVLKVQLINIKIIACVALINVLLFFN